ncbi:MAG: hypothetical protein Q7N95_12645 [Alphaproteobacteria bacterium]|nr:hypothetical protein [Alphaproteobacteria bacterium]
MLAFVDINPATGGLLVLQGAVHFTGTVTGFTFGDAIDLDGINLTSVSITGDGGFLQVNCAGGSFQLLSSHEAQAGNERQVRAAGSLEQL